MDVITMCLVFPHMCKEDFWIFLFLYFSLIRLCSGVVELWISQFKFLLPTKCFTPKDSKTCAVFKKMLKK